MNSHVTQLQFLQLAVALLSNNRTDGEIEHVLAELCLIPRNLAFIRRFLDQGFFSTRCFADQLLLPAVERQQIPLIRALLKAGANPLAIRWRKDFGLSQVTLAAHITLGTDRSGKVGGAFRQNTEDSALSLAVQLRNEAIVCALLANLGNAPIYKRRKSSTRVAGSQLGFELAILKAVDCNRASILRLILEADYVKKRLMPVIATIMPKVLEYAIATKRLESVSVLLACFGTSILVDQKALNIALSAATRRGNIMLAEQLIDLGANVNPSSGIGNAIDEEIPLGLAVQGAHTEMVRLLLKKGADPNLSSMHCARPLQIAAQTDNIELCEILLKVDADPNTPATLNTYDVSANRSAIKWALLHSAVELFFLLVSHGANVKEPMAAHDTHSVLTLALMSERIDVVDFLLDQNVWPSKDQHDRSFQACVHFYDLELVQRFVNHDVELNDTGALCAAISGNKLHIVDYLLEQVKSTYGQLPPGYGAAGLALATRLTMPHLVRLFLHHGIQPFDNVLTDVHRVAKHESPDWHGERKYLQKGTCALVEVTRCDSQQFRELQMECLDLLLGHCQQFTCEHAEWAKFQTAIDFALWCVSYHTDLEIAKLLMRKGANCFAESSPLPFQTSPLASAAENPISFNLLEWYLEYGVEEAVQVGQRQQAIDRALVACVTNLNCMNAVELLLKKGANVNFSNCQALRLAISKNNLLVIEVLLKARPDVGNIRESAYSEAYMQRAVLTRNPTLVKLLLQAGADHYNVSLAVQEAAKGNDTKIVKMLLDHGADVNVQPRLGTGDKTSLQHAATNGNFEIMKMMLEAGGDINAPRARLCGRTALEGAAEQGFLDMVRFLLEMGADVQGRDNKVYRRSVYRAWSEGNIVVAEMIQDFKRARYGFDDCVSIEEVVENMDPFGLEIEPYGE
jgi:ankyrin repeat protein